MLISGREAVRILRTRGAMTGEAQARGLLRAGAAGAGVIADTGVLFERDAVIELSDRPWLDRSAHEDVCPRGSYLARLPRATSVDLTRPWVEIAEQVGPMVALSRGGRPWVIIRGRVP